MLLESFLLHRATVCHSWLVVWLFGVQGPEHNCRNHAAGVQTLSAISNSATLGSLILVSLNITGFLKWRL